MWATHLKGKGWFDRAIVFALDEPDPSAYAAIARHAQWMQTGDPDWKAQIMDTTSPRTSNVATLDPALGIFDVCLKCYDKWYDQTWDVYGRAEWPSELAQHIKLWFYESNAQGAPYPTYATNTLLGMEPRIMHWGTWFERATGFLMWSVNTWDDSNPWGPNTLYGKTGDGVLLYPGNHDGVLAPQGSPAGVAIDGPIPSYRLKMIRAGLQDWALFALAEQRGLSTYARTQVAQAYSQLGGCSWGGCAPVNGQFYWKSDDALMMQIRRNIALAVAASLTPTPAPSAAATPTPCPSPSATPTPFGVAGAIRYYTGGAPVSGAQVRVTGSQSITVATGATGAFRAAGLGAGTWTVAPELLGTENGGVSALDAAYALQAVVGLRTLSPVQQLACDVTGSGTMSALDANAILQHVVGLLGRFPVAQACGSDWAFVPTPAVVPNQAVIPPVAVGTCVTGKLVFQPLAAPADHQDFLGVVFGDCTGNWSPAQGGAAGSVATVRVGSPRRAAPPAGSSKFRSTHLARVWSRRWTLPSHTTRPTWRSCAYGGRCSLRGC